MRPRDPDGTRLALKSAATTLFARRGFTAATAFRIARAAGVNKAMINYHFGGKRGLYTAIIRESMAVLLERLQAVERSRQAAPARLRDFIAAFGDTVALAPDLPAMLLREVLSGGEHLEREVFGFITAVLGTVRGIVESGIRDGSFREVDPLLTHLSLMGSLMFFFATEDFRRRALAETRAAPAPPSAGQFVTHLQDLMTRGLLAGPRPAGKRRQKR
jgi:AcrR family transcriptional regulator